MDLAQYLQRLNQLAQTVQQAALENAVVPNANELLATTKQRIIDGKDSDNGDIGSYSKKAGYYSKEQFVNKSQFKGIGKNGGKPRKTMYLPQGYYEFRGIQGRDNTKVNVTLSGDTNNRYQLKYDGKSVIMGMTTKKASDIRKGQEKRFEKTIYQSTKQELEQYNKNVAEDLQKNIIEILK